MKYNIEMFKPANTKKEIMAEALYKMLFGLPSNFKLLGKWNNVPIGYDPEYPPPDGEIYFINENNTVFK